MLDLQKIVENLESLVDPLTEIKAQLKDFPEMIHQDSPLEIILQYIHMVEEKPVSPSRGRISNRYFDHPSITSLIKMSAVIEEEDYDDFI